MVDATAHVLSPEFAAKFARDPVYTTLTHNTVGRSLPQDTLPGGITTTATSTSSVSPLTHVHVAEGLPLQRHGVCTPVIPPDVAAQLNRVDTDLEKIRASIHIQIAGSIRPLQEHLDRELDKVHANANTLRASFKALEK